MHEIITLQIGNRGNYLGTHFWNAQESYFTYFANEESPVDHDVHFRAGLGPTGVDTFTPRTLIYDLKAEFGSLKKLNELYEVRDESNTLFELWDGPSAVQQQPLIDKTVYQRNLEENLPSPGLNLDTVRYWSDFNRVFYHPKSILPISGYDISSGSQSLSQWGAGEELFCSLNSEHDLFDQDFRPFAEECDQLQGLQILTEVDNFWGGFAAKYMDHLRDEMGKTSMWVWGLEDGSVHRREAGQLKAANAARSICSMSPLASMYIAVSDPPATLPHSVSLSAHSEWHTSALLSTAMESVTLPSRLKPRNGTRSSLYEMENVLKYADNQLIAKLSLAVGDKRHHHSQALAPLGQQLLGTQRRRGDRESNLRARNNTDSSNYGLDIDFFPETAGGRRTRTELVHVFRRIAVLRDHSEAQDVTMGEDRKLHDEQDVADSEEMKIYQTSLQFPLPDSFPAIYPHVSHADGRTGLATRTALSIESSMADRIHGLQAAVRRLVGPEEREALLNGLAEMSDDLKSGWNGEESEEDDL